jgi:nicotinamidase-related amidase
MALPQALEPISNAVHLSIDMQNLFAPGGIWATPWMERVLPAIVAVAELNPQRTVFTRFVTPLYAQAWTVAAIFCEMGMCDTLSSTRRAA